MTEPHWGEFEGRGEEAKPIDESVARAFADTFNTASGRVVLRYLRERTKERVFGPTSPDSALRDHMGACRLFHDIERLIAHGATVKK